MAMIKKGSPPAKDLEDKIKRSGNGKDLKKFVKDTRKKMEKDALRKLFVYDEREYLDKKIAKAIWNEEVFLYDGREYLSPMDPKRMKRICDQVKKLHPADKSIVVDILRMQ